MGRILKCPRRSRPLTSWDSVGPDSAANNRQVHNIGLARDQTECTWTLSPNLKIQIKRILSENS